MDPYELIKAFDPDWNGGVPYSMVIAPGGKVLMKTNGVIDPLMTQADHPGQLPRRRLRGTERVLEPEVEVLSGESSVLHSALPHRH